MPANEIANRLAAAAWIQFLSDGADPPSYTLSLRSQVSCQGRIITTATSPAIGDLSFIECPVIIVPLDREFSRKETQILAHPLDTIDDSENRATYPWTVFDNFDETDATPDLRVLMQPLHLDWIGDPAAPSWLPFDVGSTSDPVPDGFDIDVYNAVAFMLTSNNEDEVPVGQDFCFMIFQSPAVNAETVVEATLAVQGGV